MKTQITQYTSISLLIGIIVHFSSSYAQLFENVAPQMGIYHTVNTQLLYGGHGVSFFDFDNDGWDDITFVQENDSVVLYKNNQGVFEQIPSVAFQLGEIRQALWVDYDNDGDYDLFMTSTNGTSRLYQNDGNFNFTDVTIEAGISGAIANNYGVSFADYDLDGNLDFYLARYQMTGNTNNPNHVNALYRNNGDGTFTDVTLAAGVADSIQPSFMGAWIDINKNGLPDLYVINDRVLWGNTLYLNNGDGTFTDITTPSGTSMFGQDPMGVTFGDYDNDGDIDMVLANGGFPTKDVRVYTNNGNSTFTENAEELGISVPVTFMCTWGGAWIDIDNNTFLDLYMTTGLLMPASGEVRNYLFVSDSANIFIDSPSLFNYEHVAASYSVALGDIDNDGYADMVVQNAKNFDSFIWKNNFGPTTGNKHLKVTLEGTISNRMAVGSWISVHCQENTYTHYTRCGDSFISQSSQHHIFGLGQYDIVDSLTVQYPSGILDVYYNLDINQHIYLKEGETLIFELAADQTGNTFCSSTSVQLSAPDFDSYLWNTGDTTQNIDVIESGIYYLTAWNAQGHPYKSDSIEITILSDVYINPNTYPIQCFGGNNGAIALDVFNDNQNYEITWEHGESGDSIFNLGAGIYTFEYIDEFGCEYSQSITLSESVEMFLFTQTTPQTNDDLGSIQVIVLGGVPPYEIYIDNELMAENPIFYIAGTYNLIIIDDAGCMITESVTIDFDNTSSISNQESVEYTLYPNPNNSGTIHFEGFTANQMIGLFDANGREIPYDICHDKQCINLNKKYVGLAFVVLEIDNTKKALKIVFID